jgi:uncharacterized protein (PEP-CTERM system associated)
VYSAAIQFIAAVVCLVAPAPGRAENWRLSASASATETYTSNVDYTSSSLAEGDFATSITGALQVNGDGARLKVNGSIAATGTFYASQSQNNSFAPSVNLSGTLEAIEKFAYLEARANVSQTFISPFGAQPANIVNATQNRYTQQTYAVSPYIKGVLGSSDISYQVRDDSFWTVASSYGDSSPGIPNTYSNSLSASMNSPPREVSWSLTYDRFYYDNGLANATDVGAGATTTQIVRFIATYQIDPQLQIAPRIGYERDEFPLRTTQDTVYGIGGQWNPTDRTQIGGFWEHRFFGSSYQANISHRLPNAALTANFSRGLSSFPQLALAIPAGATVSQFVDAAFATRISDPAERAAAVAQFLANSGLPPTLASPVNFYATSLTLQQTATVSLVLIGALNSVSFSIFNVESDQISATGNVLPPALQFGQNNTQTGASVGYSHRLSSFTSLNASVTYSTTTLNTTTGPLANSRTENGSASLNLSTTFTPKTNGSAGLSYSQSRFPSALNQGTSSALNVFVTVSHTF